MTCLDIVSEVMHWLLTDVKERAIQIARRKKRITGRMTIKVKTDDLYPKEIEDSIEEIKGLRFSDILIEDYDWRDDDVLVEEVVRCSGEIIARKYVGFFHDDILDKSYLEIKQTKDGVEIEASFFYWFEVYYPSRGELYAISAKEFANIKKRIANSPLA